jgi:hypothetical protein
MAVFALLVLGVLVGTSFFVGRQELAVGSSTVRLEEALAAAEGGANLQLALWDPAALNTIAIGDSVPFGGTLPAGGWYRGATRRLSDLLYLVRSEGFSRDSGARRELGMLARLRPVEIRLTAALTARGTTVVGDYARIDGADRAPLGWSDCPASEPAVAGGHVPDASDVSTAGCAGPSCVTGSPAVLADSGLDGTMLSTAGDAAFDDLRSRATVAIPGGTRRIEPSRIGGVCNTLDPDNWGSPLEPGGPCGRRFPIVWSEGDLTITGGQGQGVLVVNGNLSIGGGFAFNGVVLVRGGMTAAGAGGSVHGGVVAASAGGQQNDILGSTVILYSSCAAARGIRMSALAAPLRSRGWVMLY